MALPRIIPVLLLKGRGLVKTVKFQQPVYVGDPISAVKIFNEKEVQDVSTFDKPHAYSKGFHYVLVNGQITVDNERHIGVRAGKALYGKGRN